MIRLILLLPVFVVLVAFALSNQQSVQFGLWPTDWSIEAPVSLGVLAASGISFFLGAFFVWFGSLSARRRARKAERLIKVMSQRLSAHTGSATSVAPQPVKKIPIAPPAAYPALGAPK